MKAVFIGKYETEKWDLTNLIRILYTYKFDTVYFMEDGWNSTWSQEMRHAGFKVFCVLKFKNKSIEVLRSKIDAVRMFSDGICFDYIREENCKLWNVFSIFKIMFRVNKIKFLIDLEKEKEWHCVLKCEDYSSLLDNELNRMFYGQSIPLFSLLFDRILLMSYHQEYKQPIYHVVELILKLQNLSKKVIPIFQTYQDNPIQDYDKYWGDVVMVTDIFTNKAYFRLGTCDLDSFKTE